MKNKKWLMTIFLYLLISVIISSKFVFAELIPDENGLIPITSENIYEKTKYYRENPFGIIGGFHLVGFNSVETKAHTNGNILTNLLKYGSNFGTNNLEEISYVRQLEANGALTCGGSGQGDNSILVVGTNISVGDTDNGNAWTLNENKLDKPKRKDNDEFTGHLWQDSDTIKFIDLEQELARSISINQKLREYDENNINTIGYFEDQNDQHIEIENKKGLNVYNIKATDSQVRFDHKIDCGGFEHGENASLLINVDLNGWTVTNNQGEKSFKIPQCLIKYTDGTFAPIAEVTEWQEGNIIWNFYDSSEPDGCYTGEIRNIGSVTGIILAPKATVTLCSNLNGTVVANNIVVEAESHRTDFTGTTLDPYEDQEDGEKIKIKVKKEFVGKKLDSVTINLLGDNEVLRTIRLNDANNWEYAFDGLDKYDQTDGHEINYDVSEIAVPGYNVNKIIKADNEFLFKNEEINSDEEKIKIKVKKEFVGKKLDSVTINLLGDNKMLKTIRLNDANNWEYTFDGLDKYDQTDGHEIIYDVNEDAVRGYNTVKINKSDEEFLFINTKNNDDGGDDGGNQTPDNPDKTKIPDNFSFNSIDDNGNTDGGIVVFHPGEEKIKNNDICAINSDFDTGYDFEQKENNYNEDISMNSIPSGKKIEEEDKSENNTKELPKTGDGININFYLKTIFVSGVLLFLIGLFKRLSKKYN